MATDLSRQQPKSLSDYPPPPPVPEARQGWRTPEERAAFVRRARDVLGGNVPAEPMVTPPVVQAMVDQLKQAHPGMTSAALRHVADEWNLRHYLGGLMVAWVDLPQGRVVLARGRAEVHALCYDVPWQERRQVCIDSPLPWDCAGYL